MLRHFSAKIQGFTLLELMLALVLAVTVLTLLAGGLFAVINDWERAGQRLEHEVETALVLQQLEMALHGAFPHVYRDTEENKEYIYFEGQKDRLSWVSTFSPQRLPGLSAWQLTPGKEDHGLALALTGAYTGNPQEALDRAEPIALLESYQVRFTYLYRDPRTRDQIIDEPKDEWLDEWSAQEHQSLPVAVRIHLETPERQLEAIAVIPAHEHQRLRAQPRL
jgi:type II secretory pathway pseudopilin PulG